MTDVIDERLNKVLKEFNRMLGRPEEDGGYFGQTYSIRSYH